jgi:hypothetical protein
MCGGGSAGDDGSTDAVGSEEDPNDFGGDDPTGNTGGQTDQGISDQSSVTDDNVSTDPDAGLSYSAIASIGNVANQAQPGDVTGFGGNVSGQDVSDYSMDIDSLEQARDQAKKGSFPSFAKFSPVIGGFINNLSKNNAQNTISNVNMGYAPTYGPDGNITGTTGYGIGMGSPTGSVPGYDNFSPTSPSEISFGNQNDIGGNESDSPQIIRRNPSDPVQDNPTDPILSDELASDYLQNPYYLYSGIGNQYQPYGYAQNTLVDLLRTRNMTQPQQRAANLGLFGNPGDFS